MYTYIQYDLDITLDLTETHLHCKASKGHVTVDFFFLKKKHCRTFATKIDSWWFSKTILLYLVNKNASCKECNST